MNNKNLKTSNKRKIATGTMAVIGIGLIIGGAFAALSDTLTHNETVTIEWVEIVDGSDDDLALENVNDVTNTPVTELTPGMTYELTGTLENDSTVITDWTATDLTNVPGMTVTIADADGADTPTAVGEAVDVSQFGITVQVDQSIDPSTPLNFSIEFSSTDARNTEVPPAILAEPTAISEVFPDPAMAACVANDSESGANGDVNYLITQETLDGFEDIVCESQGITSIEGLQYMHNLTNVLLSDNQISDISPLANLTNLEGVGVGENEITDITPVANLTNLFSLDVKQNAITDFSSLTYQPEIFMASGQYITLPNTTLGTPTDVVIDGMNSEDLIITWTTPGTYVDGQLTWENPGVNSLTYTSADGGITGIITQTVN